MNRCVCYFNYTTTSGKNIVSPPCKLSTNHLTLTTICRPTVHTSFLLFFFFVNGVEVFSGITSSVVEISHVCSPKQQSKFISLFISAVNLLVNRTVFLQEILAGQVVTNFTQTVLSCSCQWYSFTLDAVVPEIIPVQIFLLNNGRRSLSQCRVIQVTFIQALSNAPS